MGCSCSKIAAKQAQEVAEPIRDDQRDAPSAEPAVNEYATRAGGKFFAALKSGTMAVIKSKYFLDCLNKRKPFGHRSEIEKKAPRMIYKGAEAAQLWLDKGRMFLLVISYCWLSKEHPDPGMFHLPYLKSTIDAMLKGDPEGKKSDEVGIILDYCSFYQEPRTEEQTKMFKECLGLINVPYGHPDVTAAKLVSVPATERRSYDDRGWTKFESDVIDSKPPAEDTWGELNVLTVNSPDHSDLKALAKNQRRPPVTPARFRSEMEERKKRASDKKVDLFTNGKDQQFLEKKYEETFSEMCAFAIKLDYCTKGFGVMEAEQLAEVLPYFTKLEKLLLIQNNLGNEGAKVLASALGNGAAPKLLVLDLGMNNIGAEGALALAKALGDGAAPMLQRLSIFGNNLGQEGQAALAKVEAGRGGTLTIFGI